MFSKSWSGKRPTFVTLKTLPFISVQLTNLLISLQPITAEGCTMEGDVKERDESE